jgi:hypothetical protein
MFTDIRAKESLARLRSTCCQSEEQSFTAFIYRQAAPYGAISNSCGSTYRYPAGALARAPRCTPLCLLVKDFRRLCMPFVQTTLKSEHHKHPPN